MGVFSSIFGTKTPKLATTGEMADKSFASTVNQIGPGFSTSFGVDPATGQRFQQFSETGDQAALTAGRGEIAQALGAYGAGTAGQIGRQDRTERSLAAGLDGGREAYEQATFDRALALLAPTQERQSRALRSGLVNTGNPIGTERARFELDQLNRNQSTQMNDLALASVMAGLQGQGQQINNLNSYSAGRDASIANDIGAAGNIFSIMQADKPQYFAPGQLLSPETVLNRSLGKAGLKQAQNQQRSGLIGGVLGAGGQVGASLLAPAAVAGA